MLHMALSLATSMPDLVLAMVDNSGNPVVHSIREVGGLMGVEGTIRVVLKVDTLARVAIETLRC